MVLSVVLPVVVSAVLPVVFSAVLHVVSVVSVLFSVDLLLS